MSYWKQPYDIEYNVGEDSKNTTRGRPKRSVAEDPREEQGQPAEGGPQTNGTENVAETGGDSDLASAEEPVQEESSFDKSKDKVQDQKS